MCQINKIFLGYTMLIFMALPVIAASAPISDKEIREVEKFFNSYVDSANNYRDDFQNKYTKDAKIKRVVIKSDGTKEMVVIPMDRYIKELKANKKTAQLVNYKNK